MKYAQVEVASTKYIIHDDGDDELGSIMGGKSGSLVLSTVLSLSSTLHSLVLCTKLTISNNLSSKFPRDFEVGWERELV